MIAIASSGFKEFFYYLSGCRTPSEVFSFFLKKELFDPNLPAKPSNKTKVSRLIDAGVCICKQYNMCILKKQFVCPLLPAPNPVNGKCCDDSPHA